jgi:hypothetical protein
MRCWRLSLKIWEVLLYSLLIDACLIGSIDTLSDSGAVYSVAGLLLVALIGFKTEAIFEKWTVVLRYREKVSRSYGKWMIGIAVMLSAVEVFLHIGRSLSATALVLAGLISIPVAFTTLKRLLRSNWNRNNATQNLSQQVETQNLQLLLIAMLPVLAARMVSLVGVLTFEVQDATLLTMLSAVLLISLQPKERSFRVLCRTCHNPTSRALVYLGICPCCAPNHFLPNVTPDSPDGLKSPNIWNRLASN